MSVDLLSFLQKKFNFSSFKQGQQEVITSVMNGQHTFALLPTGTGKSLCYQLPGYLLPGTVIIVSPLLSLMQDQVEQMQMNGEKRVIALNSFLQGADRREVFRRLDQFKFIFVSPEMLQLDYVIEKLQNLTISLFVVDEAHCISQWGYEFRPDYMRLGNIREQLGNPLTLALTATATEKIAEDIIKSLHLTSCEKYIYSVDRPNIAIKVEQVSSFYDKQERVVELVSTLEGPGIIYFSSKKLAEEVAYLLKVRGVSDIQAYHGGLDQESRMLIQQQFLNGQLDVICATSAFGMGINKENVRYVIHFHMPLQMESYLQEIGRGGRDGGKSIAILLYSPGDELLPYQLVENEVPNSSQVERLGYWLRQNSNNLQRMEEFEDEIIALAGFSETQWRLAKDFFISHRQKQLKYDEILQLFNDYVDQRMAVKKNHVYQMKKWLDCEDCRREKILNYFGEQRKIEVEDCCDLCGIDNSSFTKTTCKNKKGDESFYWKQYLSTILLNK
ncbi:RecQ family ATP-dependent DNA helicase [Bacillus dakarensis]|uniref:RecQ family ATP-dependent DNA helicase n=1 Tax=Robertmurraya dakarensis TaxID=1926278 RepID=UPI0009823CE7|nr:RecQ family ATP-dependent DNA helicase [Bacillus dakarensis]